MKTIKTLSLVFIGLLFSACSTTTILTPSANYYPTFPIQDFNTSTPYEITIWEEEDVDGIYYVSTKDDMMGLIQDTKNLRSKYNLLVIKIQEFNKKIKELNDKKVESKEIK